MDLPLDQVKAFLKGTPPFNILPTQVRDELAGRLLIEYFPRGESIIQAGSQPLDFLYLVCRGAIRLFVPVEKSERLVDLRSEGDSVGASCLVTNQIPDFSATAAEDTICYLVPKNTFLDLATRYPQVRVLAAQVLHSVQPAPAGGDMYSSPVREMIHRSPVSCPPSTAIQDAATRMTREHVGSMVVVDAEGRLMGIFTDRDLRRLVAQGQVDTQAPVETIMHSPATAIQSEALGFDALVAMTRANIHHLPVLEGRNLVGVVTQHDLMLRSGSNPMSVVKDVETAPTASHLARAQHDMDRIASALLEHGLPAASIRDVISLINDRLMRRLIEMSLAAFSAQGLGPPPADWAWVGLGSAGRREQIMRTDHDCCLVYADGEPADSNRAQEYFLALAEHIIAGLEACGFPRCQEKNMANNPRWCQPVAVWGRYFEDWIRGATPNLLKSIALFFDGRLIHGESSLVQKIMAQVYPSLLDNEPFLARLAATALTDRPPLGFFRQFVVNKSGDRDGTFDLKRSGLLPLVGSVRLLSLASQRSETGTLERLAALTEIGALDPGLARDAAEAWSFMFLLRLKNYAATAPNERSGFDWINPQTLTGVERRALRASFQVVSRLQEMIAGRHGL